jgi:hypothetical protein
MTLPSKAFTRFTLAMPNSALVKLGWILAGINPTPPLSTAAATGDNLPHQAKFAYEKCF